MTNKQSTLQRTSDKYGRQGTANLSLLLGARQGEHPAGDTSKENSWAPSTGYFASQDQAYRSLFTLWELDGQCI